jgi:RNA polymerase sigma-70 factor, ECF subfamily
MEGKDARGTVREKLIGEIPHLRRYSRALLGERGLADDLVQDTLERAVSRIHMWQAGTNLRAWMFAIMHNLHVNAAKRRSRSPVSLGAGPTVPEMPILPDQLGRLELRDLDRALGQLPMERRAIVLLVGLEGLSYQEVADVQGIPIGTVMSRLARGREELRRLLKGDERPRIRRVK